MKRIGVFLASALVLMLLPFPCRADERSVARAKAALALAAAEAALKAQPVHEHAEPVVEPKPTTDEVAKLRKEVRRLKALNARQRAAARVRRDCGCNGHEDCTCPKKRGNRQGCNCIPCHPPAAKAKRAKQKQTTRRVSLPRLAPICRA